MPTRRDLAHTIESLTALAGLTWLLSEALGVANATTVALSYLLLILLVASTAHLTPALVTSVAAVLAFNFFFLPPVGTLTIADPQNWVALAAFLAVSLVASQLSSTARARTMEALARRDELARLFDLSRDVLLIAESRDAVSVLARSVVRRFDLPYVAIALPGPADWTVFEAGPLTMTLDRTALSQAFASVQGVLEFDAEARTYTGHRTLTSGGHDVRLVPLRLGARPIGLLAAAGRPIELGTLDALAGIVAIAIERVRFLDERKAAELSRQSEELKTALLASIGHDLRTPLTAMRVAATNLQASSIGETERHDQADLILGEVERLTRLFENLLDMTRIDVGAIATEAQWTQPSQIVDAARDQVRQTLRGHPLAILIDADTPVRVDPRLTSAALAHLLENAAQYAPVGSAIEVAASAGDEGLTVHVRDRGPGLSSADLPRVFDRFYRGDAARIRRSGSGMGLSIARGLLAAAGGRVWAGNRPGGGAEFSLAVPAETRTLIGSAG